MATIGSRELAKGTTKNDWYPSILTQASSHIHVAELLGNQKFKIRSRKPQDIPVLLLAAPAQAPAAVTAVAAAHTCHNTIKHP